jgi:hypothetical protein
MNEMKSKKEKKRKINKAKGEKIISCCFKNMMVVEIIKC